MGDWEHERKGNQEEVERRPVESLSEKDWTERERERRR